jgi:hypothetical protein
MNIRIIYLSISFIILSCISKGNETEYIEFQHECPIKRISDKIVIKIIPSPKRYNKERIIELNYHGKLYTKLINEEDYKKIVNSIMQINESEVKTLEEFNEGEKPVHISHTDGGFNVIEYRKGKLLKKYLSQTLKKEDNNSFYNASLLITKAVGLDVHDIK